MGNVEEAMGNCLFGGDDECKLNDPLCNFNTIASTLLLVFSFVTFVLCLDGLTKVPRCRYGDADCYFQVYLPHGCTKQNAIDGVVLGNSGVECTRELLKKAVEGSSEDSSEQFYIPYLVTLISLVPPVLVFLATLFNRTLRTIEIGKYFLAGCTVSMLFSVRIVDDLTWDCRWWGAGGHNDHQDTCKSAFNTFCAGAFFTIVTQMSLLCIAVFASEKDRFEWHHVSEKETLSDNMHGGPTVDMSGQPMPQPYSDQPREPVVPMQ